MSSDIKKFSMVRVTAREILGDLNGVMSQLQRKMMRILLSHMDELSRHIKELDVQIESHMNPDEKKQ